MPLDLVTVPCLQDNYAFLVHNRDSGDTLLVDAPEAAPIEAALTQRGWTLSHILLTHHHADHVDGLDPLRGTAGVIGASADAHRLPDLDRAVGDGDTISLLGQDAQVLDVSGHTLGHIAVVLEEANLMFTADSLMALGCGRLFEGTPAQMWTSLQKLRGYDPDMLVCSGHEYTQTNAGFALTIEPDNEHLISRIDEITKKRASGLPTVPSSLGEELRTNPFLRSDVSAHKNALGMADADPVDVFAYVREKRNVYKGA